MISIRSFFLAMRLLSGKKEFFKNRNTLGAVLGIGLSLIPLIVVLEISSGMIEGITERYMEIGSYHLQIKPFFNMDQDNQDRVIGLIKTLPDVKSVFPVVNGEGLAYSENGRTGISFKALPPDYLNIDKSAAKFIKIDAGSFNLDTNDSAMLSKEVARILDVVPGDRIKILTARKIPGRRPVLKPSYLTVKGIFSTGYYELDALSIYINIDKGKKLFTDKNSLVLGVKLYNPFENINVKTMDVRNLLGSGYSVYNWYNLEKSMIDSFNTTKTILLFIMILIVIVAAMNISSAIVMLVMEKEEAIAMLKSTGVPSIIITKAFVYIGFVIGFFGTVTGLVFGLLTAININKIIHLSESIINRFYYYIKILLSPFLLLKDRNIVIINTEYYLDKIPIKIDLTSILIITTLTILLSVLAAYSPAKRAGRLKPMDILRKH